MGSPGEGAQDRESEGGERGEGEAKYEAKHESPRTMVKPIVGVTLEAEPRGPTLSHQGNPWWRERTQTHM